MKLPAKFNRLVFLARRIGGDGKDNREILHYAGGAYGIDFDDNYNRLWFKYYCQSPFYSAKSVMNLADVSRESIKRANQLWKKIANLSANRRRGFFIYPQDAEKVVELIGKNEDAIGLNAQFPNALDNLIETIQEYRGEIMFFINVNNDEYIKIRDTLINLGFKKDEDFFNVKELVPAQNFNKLVLEM